MKRSKKYRNIVKPSIEKGKLYSAEDAIKLLKESSYVNFTSSIDVAIKFPAPGKKSGNVTKLFYIDLPAGHGKKIPEIVAFLEDVDKDKIENVDKVADQSFMEELTNNKRLCKNYLYIASPKGMLKARKVAGILGPKGLMPNANFGTVTDNIESTVTAIKTKRVFLRLTKTRHIVLRIGDVKMDDDSLLKNFSYAVNEIFRATSIPRSVKNYSLHLTSTMGAGFKIAA